MCNSIACVSGASGTVGSRIVRGLLSRGYRVRVLSRKSYSEVSGIEAFKGDINEEDVLKNFMQGAQMFFHCAAELKDESKMWLINVDGIKQVLKYAQLYGIKYFCYLSSVGVIGRTDIKWADESTACNPQNTYEQSKWAAEQLVARGIQECKTVILRPTNVVDEDKPGVLSLSQRGSWIDFCKVFLTGGECAHIVHAEDVADAALYFVSSPPETVQCYIVSCDQDTLNTNAGLWALYNAYRRGRYVGAVRSVPHLPLSVPYILRRILRGAGNKGDVRYSSRKLREAGFVFKLGLQGAVKQIAISSGEQIV